MGCAANCLSTLAGWTCKGGGCCSYDSCYSTCGDGIRAVAVETCDDGDTQSLDGCSSTCQIEPGWNCNTAVSPTTCTEICGDGLRVGTEVCDDGNAGDSKGCAANCKTVLYGWYCSGGTAALADTCT